MLLQIDRGTKVPLYVQIHQQIRELILTGVLPAESHLPPTRDLAKALGVNRTTVVSAYRELWSEGLVEGRAGGGTVVTPLSKKRPNGHPDPLPLLWEELYTSRVPLPSLWTAVHRAPSKARAETIDFAPGAPAIDRYSLETIHASLNEIRRQGATPFAYGCAQGDPQLRALLAEQLELEGIRATPGQILVVSGSQDGIYLVAQALLERGDGVVVEAPTYPGALRIFRTIGAELHPVPLDEGGVRLDLLEGVLSHLRPKLIYVVSSFHNPTGVTMTLERRHALLELAYRYRVPILEDDPFSKLRYEGHPLPRLKALDRENYGIYLTTFSKILAPGLRVGWLLASREVVERLAILKNSIDVCTSALSQALVRELVARGLNEHLTRIVPAYRARRDAMCEALERHCAGLLRFKVPEGGLFIWAELVSGLRADPLLEEAQAEGVSFLPGTLFFPEGHGGERHLRLNFVGHPEEAIEEGVKRLGVALRRTLRRARHPKREPEPEKVPAQTLV